MVGKLARYLGGAIAAWAAFTLQGLVVYLGLLGYASISDSDTGGPLAGPFMILLAALIGIALVPLLYVPAVLCLEALKGRAGLLRRTVLTAVTVVTMVAVMVIIAVLLTEMSARDGLIAWLVALALLALPTIAAVIVVQGANALTNMLRRGGRVFHGHRSH